MATKIASSFQFLGGNSTMDLNGNSKGYAKGVSVISDANNNETVLDDDHSISEKDVNAYLQHYNKWKQSVLGHRLTEILRDYFGYEFDAEIKWNNVFMIGIFHIIAIIAFSQLIWVATPMSYAWGE